MGNELYPLFDEYGDMIALSVGYTRKKLGKTVSYFDTYTDSKAPEMVEREQRLAAHRGRGYYPRQKSPGVYMFRPTPIWEDTSKNRVRD